MVHLEKYIDILHTHHLKSTPLRLELLKLLSSKHHPMTAEEIQKKLTTIAYDQATLFRSLKKFTEAKLINTIDLGEGFLRYEIHCKVHSHHHHIMCNRCKKIEVIPFCISQEIEKYLTKTGYTNISHRMDFFGQCSTCK
jgi:Fur family ferric uptake transcriptional regulator